MLLEVNQARRAAVHRALGDPHRLAIVDALAQSDRTPGELGAVTGLGSNLLAFHLGTLEDVGVVERRVSEGDQRRRYVRLQASTLARAMPAAKPPPSGQVLFVCTHNAARSQFAAGLWRLRGPGPASSAGVDPADRVHPLAVAAAEGYGVHLAGVRPRGYDAVEARASLVVSVCDRALEQGIPFGAPRLHWSVPDPLGGDREAFEAAFADIAERVERLVDLAPA